MIFNMLSNIVKIQSYRTKNITKQVFLSFLFKVGSILLSFLLVPISIDYLDIENYGIWMTIVSFISWFSFFDIGLGNGLQNRLTEAISQGETKLAKGYVSTAYITLTIICLILILIFLGINTFVNWSLVFNSSLSTKSALSILLPIVIISFCLQMVLKLISTIYMSEQKHSNASAINFVSQLGSLILIIVFSFWSESSLLLFGIVYSIFPICLLLILNIYSFKNSYSHIKPSFNFYRIEYLKDLMGLGFLFFIVQISGIVLYATDNFLISQLYSPDKVVPYNIVYKYLGISTMAFSIVSVPFWSNITDANSKKDTEWLNKAMKNFKRLSFLFSGLLVVLMLISQFVFDIWIGEMVVIPKSLIILIGLFFASSILITPYTIYLNGLGKVKLQAIQAIAAAIVNIPLGIFLSKVCHLELNGIILSTLICFIPSIILTPIQYRKIVNNNANGIWNQ